MSSHVLNARALDAHLKENAQPGPSGIKSAAGFAAAPGTGAGTCAVFVRACACCAVRACVCCARVCCTCSVRVLCVCAVRVRVRACPPGSMIMIGGSFIQVAWRAVRGFSCSTFPRDAPQMQARRRGQGVWKRRRELRGLCRQAEVGIRCALSSLRLSDVATAEP